MQLGTVGDVLTVKVAVISSVDNVLEIAMKCDPGE